jgi:DNA-binding protein HU-beta
VSKSGLIDAISTTTSLTNRGTENAANASVPVLVGEVRAGRRVSVVGFGSFNPTQRGVPMRRNPQADAVVTMDGSSGVRLSATGALTAEVFTTTALKKMPQKSTRNAVRRSPTRKIARRPVGKVARRAPTTEVGAACSGEENSEAIGQQGRTACSGEKDRPSMPRRGKQLSDRPRRP